MVAKHPVQVTKRTSNGSKTPSRGNQPKDLNGSKKDQIGPNPTLKRNSNLQLDRQISISYGVLNISASLIN